MSGSVYHDFEAVRDRDEKILWLGKPAFVPFILSGMPMLFFGLIWGVIDYFGFIRNIMGNSSGPPAGFVIPFFALHLFPFWLGMGNMFRVFLVYGNTYYAYTTKR